MQNQWVLLFMKNIFKAKEENKSFKTISQKKIILSEKEILYWLYKPSFSNEKKLVYRVLFSIYRSRVDCCID